MSAERRIRKSAKTILDEATGPKLLAAYEAAYGDRPRAGQLDGFKEVLRALAEMPDQP